MCYTTACALIVVSFARRVSQLPVQRGQFDMSRLQLLNANADKSALSTDEAKAVASHLMANVPQVRTADKTGLVGKTRREIYRAVSACLAAIDTTVHTSAATRLLVSLMPVA